MNKVIATGTIYGKTVRNYVGADTKLLVNIIARNDYAKKGGKFENICISCFAWNDTASSILRNF